MKIITWNINSIRARLQLLERLDDEVGADVVCLQETKVVDELFPHDALSDLYPHRHMRGMKGYNGVAILSKVPFTAKGGNDWCGREDTRHISVKIAGGVEIHNFYVPAGGDEPDPKKNDKFAHKLAFLNEVTDWFQKIATPRAKRIMVGDLNIAPLESDVWSHKQLLKVVSHTPVEIEHLDRLQAAHDWVDAVRHFAPEPEKRYSWWSYRANARANNKGWRLDYNMVSEPLKNAISRAVILPEAKHSDHCPALLELDYNGL
mgnify:CR=1 FL=1